MTITEAQKYKSTNLFLNNPFNIYGLSVSSSKSDILNKHDRLLKLSKLDATDDYENDFTYNRIPVKRDIGTLQNALVQSDKLLFRYLWFSKPVLNVSSNRISSNSFFQEYDQYLKLYLDLIILDRSIKNTEMWETLLSSLDLVLDEDIKFEDYKKLEERYIDFENSDISFNLLVSYKDIPTYLLKPLEFFIEETKDSEVLSKLFNLISKHYYLKTSNLNKVIIEKFKTIFVEYKKYSMKECNEIDEEKSIDLLRLDRFLFSFYEFEKEIDSFLKMYPKRESFYEYEVLELIDIYKEIIGSICFLLTEGCKYSQAVGILLKIEPYLIQSEISNFENTKKQYLSYVNAYDLYEESKNVYFSANDLKFFENKKKLNMFIKALSGNEEYASIIGSILINKNQTYLPYHPNLGVKFLTSAANKGNQDAQYRLAMCYIEGLGVEQNRHNSIYWMKKAASCGHVEAKKIVRQYNL